MGIHGGGSPGEATRFFRATRCTSVSAPSLTVGGDLGLVSIVSRLRGRFRVDPPSIIDQAQNVWGMRIKKGRYQPGDHDDKSCHMLRQLALSSRTARAFPLQRVHEVVAIW